MEASAQRNPYVMNTEHAVIFHTHKVLLAIKSTLFQIDRQVMDKVQCIHI